MQQAAFLSALVANETKRFVSMQFLFYFIIFFHNFIIILYPIFSHQARFFSFISQVLAVGLLWKQIHVMENRSHTVCVCACVCVCVRA